MPVPRKFDRRPPERDQTRINDRIRVPEVRLIGDDGKQVGVVKTAEALTYAQERDLDLVEVAPEARPPVVRVLDYSKYKYEQAQKQKAARRHQQQITVREIKFRPKIAQNDYDTKKGHVARFLRHKDKVKITIMFRGREVTHPERGTALLDRLAGELSELAVVEQSPVQDGRNMTMLLAPSKAVLAGEKDGRPDKAADEHEANESPVADSDGAQTEASAEETSETSADETSETAVEETSESPVEDDASEAPAEDDASEAPAEDDASEAPAEEGSSEATVETSDAPPNGQPDGEAAASRPRGAAA